jgi:hypothetical protein
VLVGTLGVEEVLAAGHEIHVHPLPHSLTYLIILTFTHSFTHIVLIPHITI